MRGLIVYSSKTGNTKMLAQGVQAAFGDDQADLRSVDDEFSPDGYDWIISGYWVDRGTGDAKALRFWESLENCNVGLIGTLGAYPDSDHAKKVAKNVEELISQKNNFLGSFLCQGKVDPRLIEKFKKFPPDHPHAMNEERRKRHEEAAKHPNEQDVAEAVEACKAMVASL
ncbi:MAG: flavodoxin family protein [Spirochaetales bacterium]|nr:flavodoxin family protein [Spirochaetales bacterium]